MMRIYVVPSATRQISVVLYAVIANDFCFITEYTGYAYVYGCPISMYV